MFTLNEPVKSDDVAQTQYIDAPEELQMFQGDVQGPAALALRIKQIAEDRAGTVTFALADFHEEPVDGIGRHFLCSTILTVGYGIVDNKPCFRYCGSNGHPNGPGSHSVIATWQPYATDPACVAATICLHCEGKTIFLARE